MVKHYSHFSAATVRDSKDFYLELSLSSMCVTQRAEAQTLRWHLLG